MKPETRYARSGDVHIAYQVVGDGPLDLVFVPGFVSNLDANWDSPVRARFFSRLASFSRLILFDKRGTGLSDRTSQIFTLEQRMDDLRAVMDAAQSARAVLFGISEGGPMSVLFAATYPDRTAALALYGSYAKRSWSTEYPYGWRDEEWREMLTNIEQHWGTQGALDLRRWAPSLLRDQALAESFAAYLRAAASPGAAIAVMRMNWEIDVRQVLPVIRVPTLILHRAGELWIDVEQGRYLARHIPGAKLVELPGADHVPWVGDADAILDEVEEFVTGARRASEQDRVLSTILVTDIVGSTERAAELGDRKWRDLLEGYYGLVRRELEQFRGREIDTAGDGLLAMFDGPARAVRCAQAINRDVASLGIGVRAGLHTGEVEMTGEKPGGIAVHIGARVATQAGPGEVLVSSTVKDLVSGSGLRFEDRGVHALKGVPGEWRLFVAAA
jgi:pimeloyl-ACP methyl ester carboxylesterase